MVTITQLRISDDGKQMFINAHVNTSSYFTNAYIDSVTIITSDQVSEMSPGVPTSNYIYKKTFSNPNVKEINLTLTPLDFTRTWETDPSAINFTHSDMLKTLFFVYIKIKYVGSPDECLPCNMDKEYTLGITFDESVLYNKVMDYTRELTLDCFIPQGFTDLILLWNAFKVAIETGHYTQAIKFYNMLFGDIKGPTINSCGCHG